MQPADYSSPHRTTGERTHSVQQPPSCFSKRDGICCSPDLKQQRKSMQKGDESFGVMPTGEEPENKEQTPVLDLANKNNNQNEENKQVMDDSVRNPPQLDTTAAFATAAEKGDQASKVLLLQEQERKLGSEPEKKRARVSDEHERRKSGAGSTTPDKNDRMAGAAEKSDETAPLSVEAENEKLGEKKKARAVQHAKQGAHSTNPAKFDRLGLATSAVVSSESASISGSSTSTAAILEDLVLWNTLGYALDESTYFALSLVCKEWRRLVGVLAPPAILQMTTLLKRGKLLDNQDLQLMQVAFQELQDRTSVLYRKKKISAAADGGSSTTTSNRWPVLKTNFHAVLMQYVYELSTQRVPYNHGRTLYEMTVDVFRSVSESIASSLWKAVMDSDQDDPIHTLQQLLQFWNEWIGIVDTIKGVCGYLNVYLVPQYNLEPLHECAQNCLVRSLVTRLNRNNGGNILVNFMGRLHRVVKRQDCQSLLLEAWQVCELIRGYSWPEPQPTTVRDAYLELVPYAKDAKQEVHKAATNTIRERPAPQKQKVTIVSENGSVSLPVDSPFFQSSEFFKRLCLEGGEFVKLLKVKMDVLEKAIEFSVLDAATPFPEIQPPLVSNDMVELVGETFGNYVMAMDQQLLFKALTLANLLEADKLVTLCTATVAAMIRGRSPEEIRALFSLG